MDPFGSRRRVTNPAISKQHALALDIYDRLFDSVFFQSKAFLQWSQGNKSWQLHCYGAPGCGKTTLAAIAAQRLRGSTSRSKVAPVATIFVEKDVSISAVSFVEDLLDCIYHQLPDRGSAYDHHYEQYELACQDGESASKRITLLRSALNSRLEPSQHTFLILDGYDRVSEGLQVLLDREFADLQVHRLRVMITRRVPAFRVPLWVTCDGPDHEEEEEERLKLYWVCKRCYKNQYDCFALCYTCMEKGSKCPDDGDAWFEEIYDHVDIDVSHLDELEEYIAWELQKEFGHTQASSDSGDSPMRQDSLVKGEKNSAESATLSITTEQLRKVIQSISNNAEGNITIAKLYLDNIHKLQRLDDVEKVGDRHPRNLVALFDAGIEQIKQQPRPQSDLALMAIGAAAEKDRGISLNSLEDWMRDAIVRLPHLAEAPPRSLEDVLRSANGFIIEPFSYERRVATYNQLFALYVRENYNDTLFWARSQLNLRRVSRTLTRLESGLPRVTSPPMVSSPPSMDYSMDTISDASIHSSHGSTRQWFDRAPSSGGFPFPPKQTFSPRQLSGSSDVGSGIKKFGMSGRSLTMLPSRMSQLEFGNDNDVISEQPANDDRSQPWKGHTIDGSSSQICVFCQLAIFSSGKLFGTHQRLYKDLEDPMTKRCVFCSALYTNFLCLPKVERQELHDTKSPLHRWIIRRTAKNRESKGFVAVSFRSSQQKQPCDDASTLQARLAGNSIAKISQSTITETFYLFPETDIGHIPTKDELGVTTDPVVSGGNQIKKWIRDCDHNHPGCIKAAKTTWVPTRLLDLQTGDPTTIRLVKPADQNIKGPYMTLSHCWGPRTKENEFLTLQGETEEEYMTKGLKVTALSVNFQNAISVANFVGIRYIWIDSLCIIQGAHSDFGHEGQLMHKVYRNSYCNLAAADSVDSRGGLFRRRKPTDILPGRYRGDGSSAMLGTTSWVVVNEKLWDVNLLGASIYTRGWVFQERMLSPRILHFTRTQLFWDCGTLSACETLPSGLPLPLDDSASTDRHWRGRLQESSSLAHSPLSGANDDSLEGFWSSSVLRYTQCDLTNQADKTVAIWSIAKLVRDAWGHDYGAGMWGMALEEQLGWRVADDMKRSRRSVDLQWRQPSWSWTSIQGPVFARDKVAVDRCYRVRGHDGKVIAFESRGTKRPMPEREHSDSVKEDVDIGWREWQRLRRTQTGIQERKQQGTERSQSMPSAQTIATKPSRDFSMQVKKAPATDPKDIEPELASKSIAIHAPIAAGTLYSNTDAGSYTLKVKINTEREITLSAFPDEPPSNLDLSPSTARFFILAATEHTTPISPLGLGLDLVDYDSDNEPDVPIHTTYSGVGILLISSEEYLLHGAFKSRIIELADEINQYFIQKGGKVEKGSNEEWEVKGMNGKMDDLMRVVVELEWHKGTVEQGRHFRRMGAVEFRDWDEEAYREIMGQQAVKFWLD